MGGQRTFRTAIILLCVALIPSSAAMGSPTSIEDATYPRSINSGRRDPLIASLERFDPAVTRLIREAERRGSQDDDEIEIVHTAAVGDLDGDGGDELAVHRWSLSLNTTGLDVGYDGTLRLRVLSGKSGQPLWSFERDFVAGFPVEAWPAKLGAQAQPGLLVLTLDSNSAEAPARRYTLTALDGGGDMLWERTFQSTYTWRTAFAALNTPLGMELLDALEGPATDVLVPVLDYVDAVGRTTPILIDGRDGSLVHRAREIGIMAWPNAAALGDIDRDGKRDYIVVTYRPDTQGRVIAYSGIDGSVLWDQAGVELDTPSLWGHTEGDLTGDRIPDVLVPAPTQDGRYAFHVLDGSAGDHLYEGIGMFPYRLGDVNGNGIGDLGVKSGLHEEDRTGSEFRAYAKNGRLLYRRRHWRNLPDCSATFCLTATFLVPAGDVDDDGISDTYVETWLPGDDMRRHVYLVRGGDGRKHLAGSRAVPLLASLDGRGDDIARVRKAGKGFSIEVMDGRDGSPLWKRRVGDAGTRHVGAWEPYGSAARLSRGGPPDLFLTFARRKAVEIIALSGHDGSRIWTRHLK